MSKTALVTGASSGIGQAIAIRLSNDGYKVLVHYHKNLEGAQHTLSLLKSSSHHKLIQFDSKNFDEIEQKLKSEDVDVLVNNAGAHKDGFALLMDNKDFENIIATNLFGPFYLSKICGKKMLLKKAGVIVNMTSLAGQTGNIGQANYAASKAGLIALTKTMAMELGPRGIRVNAVAPGFIQTEMIQTVPEIESYKSKIPLKRFGLADEVAGAVSFLCSEDAKYITGHTLSINGGLFPS